MNITVVSMIHEPWGGSEELWSAAATVALKQHHTVIHSSAVKGIHHPKINRLVNLGLKQIVRQQYVPDNRPLLVRAIVKRLYYVKEFFFNRFSHLDNTEIDAVLYVGTTYSIANDYDLIKWVKAKKIPLYINCQLNFEEQFNISVAQQQQIIDAFETAKKIFFVSDRNRQVAFKKLGKVFSQSIVLRNPVNMSSIERIPFLSLTDTTRMAMVGNLHTQHKGQDLIIQLLGEEKWKHRNWHLNIFGTGPDELHLKKLVQRLQLDDKITFHGRVTDIRSIWHNNHILLMPSHMEGMPLAVVEAMICGRPALVTDVGGHTEWITDGVEGFVAPAASVASLEKTMEICWQQKHNWEQMGIAAHKKAMELYDPNPGQTLLDLMTQKK